jgi:hypothetical protein
MKSEVIRFRSYLAIDGHVEGGRALWWWMSTLSSGVSHKQMLGASLLSQQQENKQIIWGMIFLHTFLNTKFKLPKAIYFFPVLELGL